MEVYRIDWLKNRTTGLGGSDAGVVLGVSPYKSRLELWTEKVTGNVIEEDNADFHWGKLLEPVIAEEYQRVTGRVLIESKKQIRSSKHPFMFANVDRFITGAKDKKDVGVLEIKTKGAYVHWENNEIPVHYELQLQHYLAVTGYSWGSFAIFDMGKKELIIKDIESDEAVINELIEEEKKFWELVQSKTPPEVDGSEACGDFLRNKFPDEICGKVIDLKGDMESLKYAVDLKMAKQGIKQLKEEELECKNFLMFKMGEAEKAIGDGYTISWKSPKDENVFDVEKFKIENPELYREYTEPKKQTRRFSIKFGKDE